MPYHDRDRRLAMSRAHHAQHRPSPMPLPQEDGALPPYGAIVTSDDGTQIQCHVCGRWFAQLPMHSVRKHGLTAAAYKERYGLARGASLLSPHTAELQRQASIARDQASKGIPFGPNHIPPKRTGIENRLATKIRYSEGKKGTYRGRPRERKRAVGEPERMLPLSKPTAPELHRVGIEIVRREPLTLRCQQCHAEWRARRWPAQRLSRNYWKCQNGCNAAAG